MQPLRMLVRGVGASIMLWSISAGAQFGGAPVELELIRITDDVYVIFNEYVPGNTTALVTDEGVLLVDNKFPTDYENLMGLLRSVTDQPVRYVVNSHYHGDHSGSNALLQAQEGAQVIASENARIKMIDGNQPGLPNLTMDDHMRLYLGGVPVEIFHFGRAHTDGDIAVYLPDHNIMIMGDMYTNGDGLPQLVDYAGGGSMRAWPATLASALQYDFDTVIPGHGRPTDRAALEQYQVATQRLQDTVRDMRRAQRSSDDIEAVLRSEFGFEDFHIQMSLGGLLVELQ